MLQIPCPNCKYVRTLTERENKTVSKSFTTDCRGCGSLLLVENGETFDFHVKMNEEEPNWPKDGAGTGSISF